MSFPMAQNGAFGRLEHHVRLRPTPPKAKQSDEHATLLAISGQSFTFTEEMAESESEIRTAEMIFRLRVEIESRI
jgi:hypothetical protein